MEVFFTLQTSESFRLSAVLAFSGGFQDAYTYNMRDHVFANAQTGNVVLMSQNFMQGNAAMGVHYMFLFALFDNENISHYFYSQT